MRVLLAPPAKVERLAGGGGDAGDGGAAGVDRGVTW